MLSQLLARRASAVVPMKNSAHAIRWRGEGVSRVEGLSDAVFGFSVTLLVVALEVPKNAADLIENAKQFVPFAWSFFVLYNLWRAQFEFFRRHGLEDARTINLTGVLLVLVLFAVYPLKFLSLAIGAALISGPASIGRYMRLEDLPRVLGLYGLGFFGITIVFSLLYSHALSQRESLGLNALEVFDTRGMQLRWRRAARVGAAILSWCSALLLIGDHFRARDELFRVVWWVVVRSSWQPFSLRSSGAADKPAHDTPSSRSSSRAATHPPEPTAPLIVFPSAHDSDVKIAAAGR